MAEVPARGPCGIEVSAGRSAVGERRPVA